MTQRPDDSADEVAVVYEVTCLSDMEVLRQDQVKEVSNYATASGR